MGFEAPVATLGLLMFGSLGVLLVLGMPMAFALGSTASIFLFLFGSPQMLNMLPARVFPFMRRRGSSRSCSTSFTSGSGAYGAAWLLRR
jgi:TRAP-type mannitol/chloroaromatic compound transport system permease large subunit